MNVLPGEDIDAAVLDLMALSFGIIAQYEDAGSPTTGSIELRFEAPLNVVERLKRFATSYRFIGEVNGGESDTVVRTSREDEVQDLVEVALLLVDRYEQIGVADDGEIILRQVLPVESIQILQRLFEKFGPAVDRSALNS